MRRRAATGSIAAGVMPRSPGVPFSVHTVCTVILAGQRPSRATTGRVPHSDVHAFHRMVHRVCTPVHTASTGLSTGVQNSALTVLGGPTYVEGQMRPSAESVRRSQGEGKRRIGEAEGLFSSPTPDVIRIGTYGDQRG